MFYMMFVVYRLSSFDHKGNFVHKGKKNPKMYNIQFFTHSQNFKF